MRRDWVVDALFSHFNMVLSNATASTDYLAVAYASGTASKNVTKPLWEIIPSNGGMFLWFKVRFSEDLAYLLS